MLNTARQCLLVLILLLCSLSSLAVTRIHPNTLIVFGDGNVDNGLTYVTGMVALAMGQYMLSI